MILYLISCSKFSKSGEEKNSRIVISSPSQIFLTVETVVVAFFNKANKGEPIGTGFKICSLLFVNTIAGILMLCDKN